MFIAWAFSIYDIIADYHNIPNGWPVSFADGDDADLPIALD